jgi:hypothetical protein
MSNNRLVRCGAAIIAMATSLFSVVLWAPSAFALIGRPVGSGSSPALTPHPAPTHGLVTAGMAGWQVALIAIGSGLFVATFAVITARVRQSYRKVSVSAA